MDTRIIILSDNRTDNPLLQTEHGLSVYMECGVGKLLLDTGASDLFIRNAEALGIDLREVDYCLISHGHNDHIGGLPFFLQQNQKAKVILSSEIPGAEYASVRRYQHSITGDVDFSQHRDRFIFVNEDMCVDDIHVYTHLSNHYASPWATAPCSSKMLRVSMCAMRFATNWLLSLRMCSLRAVLIMAS